MNDSALQHLESCKNPECPTCRIIRRRVVQEQIAKDSERDTREGKAGYIGQSEGDLFSLPSTRDYGGKPRRSLAEEAEARRRCRSLTKAGLPCHEFGTPVAPYPDMSPPYDRPPYYESAEDPFHLPHLNPNGALGTFLHPMQKDVALAPNINAPQLRWSYGVTTVPERRTSTLPRTLASLERAGFPNPRLFVDGDTESRDWDRIGLEKTFRWPRMYAYPSWLLGVWELYLRNPNADRYAMFQDDLVTYRNLRRYLEVIPYPDPKPPSKHGPAAHPGYLNLYTFPHNYDLCPMHGRYTGWFMSDQSGKGAVALVFSRTALVALLTNQAAIDRANAGSGDSNASRPNTDAPGTPVSPNHKPIIHLTERSYNPTDPKRQYKNIDGGVVDAMRLARWAEYVHAPTLVQHTGYISAVSQSMAHLGKDFDVHGTHPMGIGFQGEDFDAMEFLSTEPARK